ncbi:Transcriptional regulator containing an amidase domain and an AraC-type DNA-binding HTH domain [Crenothrix polyspora]|jgi:transcriptional regulator GlxA family with amidase domain|uniref:Transcriptional regulator containing an amidase domain and an AraC-type DNA-binding HTH domain n=1 Tax=Crenothrix polyspora TaxID=360316 RepID=A0A1R4HDH1_9GAMM|nr:GlxA family transcriptional regulator [Crenothrix polyspora]SJM94298.1 Transcriptional regulator containing an amidase domain and an AraC-type DNA-binding HTH domain [Crenothrix polyspora]
MAIPFSPPSDDPSPPMRIAEIRPVGIVVFPGAEILDITGPMEVFAFANVGLQRSGVCTEPPYPLEVLAAKPGALTTSCGLQIIADKAYSDVHDGIDTLLIAGTPDVSCLLCDPELQDWVRTIAPRVRRLASVCTGAFLLAESGLLDGLRATSHWDYCAWLARDYPAVTVEPDRIFVRDGAISTSGGITSGIDMALAMVEEDWGSELALLVARYLVVFLKRPGGQSQFSAYLTSEAHRPDLKDLQAWIMMHLAEDLRVETLAERLFMSPRNFARFFLAETGMTPAKFVELARIDAARHYLGSTQLSIEVVADKSGFGDTERMRRAFTRQLGVNPNNYRDRFSGSEPQPLRA